MKDQAQSLQTLRHLIRLRVVGRSDVITVTWLAIAAVLPFIHLRFGARVIDPFIMKSIPMPANWFVYLLASSLGDVCFSVFAFRCVSGKWKTLTGMWMIYCMYDLFLFLWCYNEKSYYYLPYALMLIISWKMYKK